MIHLPALRLLRINSIISLIVNAKFNDLQRSNESFMILVAVLVQYVYIETWLTEDADVSLMERAGYKLILQGMLCAAHGVLFID